MTTLLVAEYAGGELSDATAKALTAAVALGADVHVLVAGKGVQGVADAASKLSGVAKVLLAESDALEHQLGHTVADLDCRDGTRAAERQRPGRSLRASALSAQLSQAGSDLGVGRLRWRSRAAGRTMEVVVAVVEEDHSHVTAVVGVDHARPRVDEVLPCQARARRCTPRKAQGIRPAPLRGLM